MALDGSQARPRSARERTEIRAAAHAKDEELIVGLLRRDTTALDLLFGRYSRLVFGIAKRVLNDAGEAEDVVQETFFHLYRRAALFDPLKGTAKAWIIRIAFHRALDRKSYLDRRGFYSGAAIDSIGDGLPGVTDLDREIGATIDRAQLEKAFGELPEAQRRTLEWFYFEGLDLREVAARLNESLGNVRHHYYRGLEHLRNSAFVRKLRNG